MSKTDTFSPRTVRLVDDRRVSVDPDLPVDVRIRLIAEAQQGRCSRRQLLAAGIDTGVIVRRVRSGRLELVHRGVYGLPQTGELPLAAEAAALLACGEGAVLSHHSAVTLHGLRVGTARPVHVTIDGARGCRALTGVRVHRSVTITPADTRLHSGLPVTSPARTLLDVAATLTDRDVEQLLAEALFARRLLKIEHIDDVIARAGGHGGRARLTRVAAEYSEPSRTDSPPEERLLQLIRAAGLPEPRTQVPVLGYRLDFFWPELRLAVEVDAYGTHGSAPRFEGDRRRDARLLTERGISVIRMTRGMIEQRPWEAIALLARGVGQRQACTINAFEVGGDGKPV